MPELRDYLVKLDKDGNPVGNPIYVPKGNECDTGIQADGHTVHLVQVVGASDAPAAAQAQKAAGNLPHYPHRAATVHHQTEVSG